MENKFSSKNFFQKPNHRICFSILISSQDRKTNSLVRFFWKKFWLKNLLLKFTDLYTVGKITPDKDIFLNWIKNCNDLSRHLWQILFRHLYFSNQLKNKFLNSGSVFDKQTKPSYSVCKIGHYSWPCSQILTRNVS